MRSALWDAGVSGELGGSSLVVVLLAKLGELICGRWRVIGHVVGCSEDVAVVSPSSGFLADEPQAGGDGRGRGEGSERSGSAGDAFRVEGGALGADAEPQEGVVEGLADVAVRVTDAITC